MEKIRILLREDQDRVSSGIEVQLNGTCRKNRK